MPKIEEVLPGLVDLTQSHQLDHAVKLMVISHAGLIEKCEVLIDFIKSLELRVAEAENVAREIADLKRQIADLQKQSPP